MKTNRYNQNLQDIMTMLGYFIPLLAWLIEPRWYYKEDFNRMWEGFFGIVYAILTLIILLALISIDNVNDFHTTFLTLWHGISFVALCLWPFYFLICVGPMLYGAYINSKW